MYRKHLERRRKISSCKLKVTWRLEGIWRLCQLNWHASPDQLFFSSGHMIKVALGERPLRKMAPVTAVSSEAPLEPSATDTWSSLLPGPVGSLLPACKEKEKQALTWKSRHSLWTGDHRSYWKVNRIQVLFGNPLWTYWYQYFCLWLNGKSLPEVIRPSVLLFLLD